MKRYVDVDYTIKALSIFGDKKNGNQHFLNGIETAKEVISNQTTADVRENVKGEWIRRKDKPLQNWYQCSICGAICGDTPRYCSECGADMRGEA